ncbi:MAG: hypothetical protein RLZZ366_2366 [Pseudomonadota bacterium]|jgi:hypothetical protein
MKRKLIWSAVGTVAAVAAWQAAPAIQNAVLPPKPVPVAVTPAAAKLANSESEKPKSTINAGKLTPMAERVATIGLLNKRNGLWRDLTMKPGQAVHIGDVVIRLKACETTAPTEPEQLTGAFVQVIVHGADTKWRKVFSGWLYKESPSLNVVEHPVYDVWTKACAMKYPDVGPDTTIVHGGDDAAAAYDESSTE